MTARFILSLDCEGKWGVADHLDATVHATLSNDRLRQAYASIIALLDRFGISATFAFVGLFAEPEKRLRELGEQLDDMAETFPEYLGPALADWRCGSGEGWSGEWAVDLISSARHGHEIGFHGVTHVPWDRMDTAALDKEIALYRNLSSPVRESDTMVFPRNRIAHVDRLADLGIVGYRTAVHRSRIGNLLAEFNPFVSPEDTPGSGKIVGIPAGHFINWQSGARRMVPRALSRMRAARLLERARVADQVVHFWLHPENIASAPATLDRLSDILAIVARERDAGRCSVETQREFCSRLAPVQTTADQASRAMVDVVPA